MSSIGETQTPFCDHCTTEPADCAESVIATAESPSDNGGEYEQCQAAIRRVTNEETRARLNDEFWRKMLNGPR